MRRLNVIFGLLCLITAPALADLKWEAPKESSILFLRESEKKTEVFDSLVDSNREGKTVYQRTCPFPVPAQAKRATECVTVKTTSADEYERVLANQLGVAGMIPVYGKIGFLRGQIKYMKQSIVESPGLKEDLENSVAEAQKMIDGLEKQHGVQLKKLEPAFKLFDRIIAHLSFRHVEGVTVNPNGWQITAAETLVGHKVETDSKYSKLIDLVRAPFAFREGLVVKDSEFQKSINTGKQYRAVINIASAGSEEAYAQLTLDVYDGDPIGSQFNYYDHKHAQLASFSLPPYFIPAVGPKAMVEVEKGHFLIVGTQKDTKGKKGITVHVKRDGATWKVEGYVIAENFPRAQSVLRTKDGNFLVACVDLQKVYLLELDKEGMRPVRTKIVLDKPIREKVDFLDTLAIPTSDGDVVLMATGATRAEGNGITTTTIVERLSADWKEVTWSRVTAPGARERVFDGTAMADGKVALAVATTDTLLYDYYPLAKQPGNWTRVEIVDKKGNLQNIFEQRTTQYSQDNVFHAIDYNPESRQLGVITRLTESGTKFFLLSSEGTVLGKSRLPSNTYDYSPMGLAALSKSSAFIVNSNAKRGNQLGAVQHLIELQKD